MINIVGLHKADVLAALYNASRPQGLGFLHYDKTPMGRQEAEKLLQQSTYFDYLKGRVMKLDLTSDIEFDEWGYDRDNGNGAANQVIQTLRQGLCINNPEIKRNHNEGKISAAEQAKSLFNTNSGFTDASTFVLGLSDVKNILEPKITEATKGR